MTNQIQLLPEGSEYRVMTTMAVKLGINYVGVNKGVLLNMINEKITKINSGEAQLPVTVEEENHFDEILESKATKKWYEEDNAFPYQVGEVVTIVSGKDLHGRKLQIIQPSAKKNAVKGYLIHPTTGLTQKTMVSIDFDRLERESQENVQENEAV